MLSICVCIDYGREEEDKILKERRASGALQTYSLEGGGGDGWDDGHGDKSSACKVCNYYINITSYNW